MKRTRKSEVEPLSPAAAGESYTDPSSCDVTSRLLIFLTALIPSIVLLSGAAQPQQCDSAAPRNRECRENGGL